VGGIDLHTHTIASDGTYTPAELVREAVRRSVRVLALTDHDSVDAVAPALLVARDHPLLEIVPGIEINTDDPGGEIHVLGYFVDHEAAWFRDLLREFRVERAQRAGQLRPDVAGTDLGLVQVMLTAVADFTRDVAPESWRRFLMLTLDGLRAERAAPSPLPASALDPAQITEIMDRYRPHSR